MQRFEPLNSPGKIQLKSPFSTLCKNKKNIWEKAHHRSSRKLRMKILQVTKEK